MHDLKKKKKIEEFFVVCHGQNVTFLHAYCYSGTPLLGYPKKNPAEMVVLGSRFICNTCAVHFSSMSV